MNILTLSGEDMVLAAVPFLLTLVAAIYWMRAIKSKKYGADIDEKAFEHPTDPDQNEPADRKWYRLLSAATYLVTFQVLLLIFPRFGWYGVTVISPVLLIFLLFTVWLLYPERLTRDSDDPDADEATKGRRQKLDELFWQSIPVKRWFVAGPKMMVIEAVRRGLALILLILVLLFGAFAEDDSNTTAGKSETSTSQATVADTQQTKTPKAVVSTPSASPSVGNTPSASPSSTPSATKAPEKPKDCSATPSMASDDTNSTLTTEYIQVCSYGVWKSWDDVYPDTNTTIDVVFKEWADKGDYGYGRITFGDDDKSALIRFKKSDI